jgi:hypothetical protein
LRPSPGRGIIDPGIEADVIGGRNTDMEMAIGIALVIVSIIEMAAIVNIVRGNYPHRT